MITGGVGWTVFTAKTYRFWQLFQDFPLEKDSKLLHRLAVWPVATSVTFLQLSLICPICLDFKLLRAAIVSSSVFILYST